MIEKRRTLTHYNFTYLFTAIPQLGTRMKDTNSKLETHFLSLKRCRNKNGDLVKPS